MNNDNINKKSDSFNFTDVVKKINSDSEGTPWYKKKVSIISMSSVLGVGALATVIAVPIALTSGNTSSPVTKDWIVSGIKSIYDLTNKNAKLIISGTKLPTSASSYKVISSTITNAKGPITSNITVDVLEGDKSVPDSVKVVQLGFNDSTLVESTKYQVVIDGDSTPINTGQHILQPIINIGTQPTSTTIASSTASKKVTLTVVATVQNPIEGATLKYQWYLSDTNDQNNSNSWTDIIGATSASHEYDATPLSDATKKYFRCVVSYVYTEAKPSSSAYVEKEAGTPPPPEVSPTEAIATFNKKSKDDKLTAYNTIMANATNNTAIKDYFIKNEGMSKFFNENVQPITSGNSKTTYDNFKTFLPTYKNSTTVTYKPVDGANFLKIKAIGKTDSTSGNTVNTDGSTEDTNIYCEQAQNLSTNIGRYVFYSPIVNTIQNVTMNSDFSITMSLSTDSKVTNTAFKVFDSSFYQHYILYKSTIKFSDITLFPDMSKFVKTNILNLKA